jgi:hypothetical protein
MRNTLISLFLIFYCNIFLSGQHEENTEKLKLLILKTDILMPTTNMIIENNWKYPSLTFEVGTRKRHSFQLTAFYFYSLSKDVSQTSNMLSKNKYKGLTPYLKFYLSKEKNLSGFYSGIYSKISYETYETSIQIFNLPEPYNASSWRYKEICINPGFIFGYQNYINGRVVIDFMLGLGYNLQVSYEEEVSGNFVYDRQKFDALFALNIGYKFRLKK